VTMYVRSAVRTAGSVVREVCMYALAVHWRMRIAGPGVTGKS